MQVVLYNGCKMAVVVVVSLGINQCDWCGSVSDEDEELCSVRETPAIGHVDADTHQRLYGRQQISFTVRNATVFCLSVVLTNLCLFSIYLIPVHLLQRG